MHSVKWIKLDEWQANTTEETTCCIWCKLPIVEPPYVGTILDTEFPGLKQFTHYAVIENDFFPSESPESTPSNTGIDVEQEAKGLVETVAEAIRESEGGLWETCSGCHNTEDGHDVGHYPYSKIFQCKQGSGCHECGGIGVVWNDYNNYPKPSIKPSADVPDEATINRMKEKASVWNDEIKPHILRGMIMGWRIANKLPFTATMDEMEAKIREVFPDFTNTVDKIGQKRLEDLFKKYLKKYGNRPMLDSEWCNDMWDGFKFAASHAGRQGDAVAVLDWLLKQSDLGIIIMNDGCFYYEEDKDGDQPLESEDIVKLYLKENPKSPSKIEPGIVEQLKAANPYSGNAIEHISVWNECCDTLAELIESQNKQPDQPTSLPDEIDEVGKEHRRREDQSRSGGKEGGHE